MSTASQRLICWKMNPAKVKDSWKCSRGNISDVAIAIARSLKSQNILLRKAIASIKRKKNLLSWFVPVNTRC